MTNFSSSKIIVEVFLVGPERLHHNYHLWGRTHLGSRLVLVGPERLRRDHHHRGRIHVGSRLVLIGSEQLHRDHHVWGRNHLGSNQHRDDIDVVVAGPVGTAVIVVCDIGGVVRSHPAGRFGQNGMRIRKKNR